MRQPKFNGSDPIAVFIYVMMFVAGLLTVALVTLIRLPS